MATDIKCPNCQFEFPLEKALDDELKESLEKEKQELRQKMLDFKKTKDEEIRRMEEEFSLDRRKQQEKFQTQLDAELKKRNEALEESIRKSLTGDFENQIRLLKDSNTENEEKLKLARKKELEF